MGSSTSEAFHSPWEKELRLSGRSSGVADALAHMRKLYTDRWKEQYGWEADTRLDNFRNGDDPALVNGAFLPTLDRTSAFEFRQNNNLSRYIEQSRYDHICF